MGNISFQSKKRLTMLKKRTKRCVCKYCGGKLKLKRIIFSDYEDARIEIFCDQCDRIEFGVEPQIYQSAKYFVENSRFNCFSDMDENTRTKQMTISKVCEIMSWENQMIGILNENGFNINLNMKENIVGECITLKNSDIDHEENNEIEDQWALE